MLRESYPWKRELKKLKLQLVKISRGPVSGDAPDFKIERPILYSAIVVRRLIESWKVTDVTRALKYSVDTYSPRSERQRALMRLTMQGDIDIEFDLTRPKPDSMDAWEIASELLHSGFINWEVDEGFHLVAIFLASKRNQRRRLIRLQLADYLRVLDAIVGDHITEVRSLVGVDGKLTIEIL